MKTLPMRLLSSSVIILLFGLSTTLHLFFNDGIPVKTIWGFYNTKKGEYHAPINFKKCGEVVSFDDTRDYTAMQLNLNPLQAAFM